MPAITYTGDLQMTHPSTAATRLKYGDHRIVILPNPFESKPIEDAIAVIGDERHEVIKAKANSPELDTQAVRSRNQMPR